MACPVTPVQAPRPTQPADSTARSGHGSSAGVEKFIGEFKKEIERLRSSEPEELVVEEHTSQPAHQQGHLAWEEVLERTQPQEVQLFTRQLTSELAAKLAELIAAKIDSDKLLQLIKNEIVARSSEKKRP